MAFFSLGELVNVVRGSWRNFLSVGYKSANRKMLCTCRYRPHLESSDSTGVPAFGSTQAQMEGKIQYLAHVTCWRYREAS
jgi:hypothetical protein